MNKKTGMVDQKFADVLEDLNQFSLNAENGPMKFLQAALECVTKGTVVVYEGYKQVKQKQKLIDAYDSLTGKVKYKEGIKTLFDNCFQEVVPLEDFYITNPFEADVQKQPKIIWRKITSHAEGEEEFGHYKNWKYVKPGGYTVSNDTTTFYRNVLLTTLEKEQIEILRYYCRGKNEHRVLINGIVIYDGPIPFKDGKYPFAKAINEPFANDFFWGNGHPNKYMGEQDLINSFVNAMADKTINSTMTTGLSSDLDDLIDDDVIEMGKWRRVGDIDKWKYLESPPVNSGEMNMFQQVMSLASQSANIDTGNAYSPKGGKLSTQQLLLKQQQTMQQLSFSMNFLEDMERDRTELRLSHILQFYSIAKIQKITGKDGKEVEKLAYRDIQLSDTKLSDGRKGTRIIKLMDGNDLGNADNKQKVADDLSVIEAKGDISGSPVEALALSVDSFDDFNNSVQVVKASSYERNQATDQASRMQFAQWRISMAQVVPIPNPKELIAWVEEAFDIDTDRFEAGGAPSAPPGMGGGSGQPVNPNMKGANMAQNAPAAASMASALGTQ